ncbi:xanthine dehydrogenase family protein molybdopterin-binding subunit [Tritonibacter mobilis]|uniref:xanthine dehydrogenase family protein molybdopterin-binding subunit n=1 Tax=Tritonibacter mobilis TaxID=379347 RepID=UPI001C0A4E67|nr:molybdopterin cofactor-binding domain-containing protein [Tritonibacter mobilis]MBU3033804.1 molybdopterin-dependent oxidoreductase [Tritonibacter mobilis]WHQ84857.1 molybdopterin-dependent oxidoreductase [Tritonibacter mobilis]
MSRAGKIARRTFLIGSAAIAGGVAFGVYMAKKPIPNPLLDDLKDGEAAITPFVMIDANGITLITPRADKGQGAYSIQAYLIAEELDIDPATATITPGMPGQAYYNATVLGEGVPIPAYKEGFVADTLRDFMSVPAKLFSIQMTGGSSTVPDGFDRMRMAGAAARETLKEAAARRVGVARGDLRTENGAVILPDGTSIAYTDLAAEAAEIDPVTDVTLRPASAWRYLGKPDLPRLDMLRKCTGTEVYGIDMEFQDMLHATVRANPAVGTAGARVEASAAEGMRGVEKILPVSNGVGVIANNTWRAFQAAEALEIEWSAPDYPGTSGGIFAALEQALGDPDRYDHRQRDEGDVDAALEAGDVIDARYRIPYLAHAPMEPMNAVVRVLDGQVEIWTGTQIPLFIRDRAATIAGVAPEAVKVYVLPMGGSFGHRLEMTHVEQAVELALAVPGRHLKLTWSREEDMSHDYPRPASVAAGRGKVADGKVVAFDLSVSQSAMAPEWFGRLSGMSLPGPDATITTGSWDQPFDIPNYRVTGYRAPSMVPVSSWRSVGASGNGFYHDCFLDELIHAAGADPLAERIRLCLHEPARKVLEAVGEMSGWDGPSIGEGRGRGVGFCMSFGVPCAQVIEVTQTDAGIRIDQVYVAVDVGEVLDPTNLEAQVFGGVIFGLGHAMNCALTYEDHAPLETNYHAYEGMRLYQAPQIEVRALSNGSRIRGVGEPAVPPAAPALANAIFAATGQRIRELPLNKHIDFV